MFRYRHIRDTNFIKGDTVTQNNVSQTITSSGSLYRICGAVAASLCPFFTCNAAGYIVYTSTNSAIPSLSSYW